MIRKYPVLEVQVVSAYRLLSAVFIVPELSYTDPAFKELSVYLGESINRGKSQIQM